MKNLTLLFILTFALLGCSTTVTKPFPPVPAELKEGCPELTMLPENTDKLSDVLKNVTGNYAQYHICRSKVDLWIEWYNTNKKINDGIKR